MRWTDRSFDPRAPKTSQAVIAFRRAATVDVAIYQGGTLVRTVWTDRAVKAGTYRWTWSGKTAAGKYVKPGTYKITVTATQQVRHHPLLEERDGPGPLTPARPYTCRR